MSAAAAQAFISEVWGLQGTAYLVVALRYYSRITKFGWGVLGWEDFFMLLATFTYTAESVAAYFVVAYWQGLANNAMTDAERAALDLNSNEAFLRESGSKTHVIGLLLYATLLWLLKGCWIIYYIRMTEGVQDRKRLVRIALVILPATYVACLLVAFFKCVPFQNQWQIYPNPGNNCMPAISSLQTVFVMVMNTITDFYLMAIPLPMIWRTQLPWKKKIGVMLMFSGGFLEMAFGIMRSISIMTLGDIDPAQSGYWSVRESFVSFVLTNLPAIYPLIKGAVDKTMLTYGSRSAGNATGGGGGDKSGGNGYRLDSYPRGSRTGGKSRGTGSSSAAPKIRHPWDSEEKIVEAPMKSPASVVTTQGGLPDHHLDRSSSSQEDDMVVVHGHENFITGECPGLAHKSAAQVMAAGGRRNWKRGSQPVNMEQPNGIMVTKAYEFRVSEVS